MGKNILDEYMERNADRFRLDDIEIILLKAFEDDDSHVVSMIVGMIRSIEGLEEFAYGACFADHKPKPDPCPHCIDEDKNTVRVIYGYTDDGDQDLNDRHGKDLYLAGCVPDGYGIDYISPTNRSRTWYYPTRYCISCKKFFMYEMLDKALAEAP